ncbi:RNA recognition motif domain-containing protein [Glaciecola sp. MH2013]|uniref:RNA recognition motif domain-containing protein n=1 Tax=Glaciecola sp. MH2013 TaxID=2785524 RepID=UPI00351C4FA7
MKMPLIVVASIILAVIGYIVTSSVSPTDASIIQKSTFSIGVLATAVTFVLLGSLTKTKGTSTPSSSSTSSGASIDTDNDDIATLYVGNLPYRANEQVVKEHFESFGFVKSVRLMKDKRTGKRKGFGFVEVGSAEAETMIEKLNDSEFQERTIKVRPAKDKVA